MPVEQTKRKRVKVSTAIDRSAPTPVDTEIGLTSRRLVPAGPKPLTPERDRERRNNVRMRVAATGISPLEMIMMTARDLWEDAHARDAEGQVKINVGKRLQACALAEKAMPYLHARLTAVSVDSQERKDISDFTEDDLLIIASATDAEEDITGQAGG